MLSLELLDANIAECRQYVNSGHEKQETLDMFLELRESLAHATPSDWAAYNEITDHLPTANADPTLIILKGQLLIEKLIRKFIASRLPNPLVFSRQQFNASTCITIAESMCLDNEEPRWLWAQVRELNAIRNKLAHSLESENVGERISNFIATVSRAQNLEGESLAAVIARLYGMLKGLCDLAESDAFRAFKQ